MHGLELDGLDLRSKSQAGGLRCVLWYCIQFTCEFVLLRGMIVYDIIFYANTNHLSNVE